MTNVIRCFAGRGEAEAGFSAGSVPSVIDVRTIV